MRALARSLVLVTVVGLAVAASATAAHVVVPGGTYKDKALLGTSFTIASSGTRASFHGSASVGLLCGSKEHDGADEHRTVERRDRAQRPLGSDAQINDANGTFRGAHRYYGETVTIVGGFGAPMPRRWSSPSRPAPAGARRPSTPSTRPELTEPAQRWSPRQAPARGLPRDVGSSRACGGQGAGEAEPGADVVDAAVRAEDVAESDCEPVIDGRALDRHALLELDLRVPRTRLAADRQEQGVAAADGVAAQPEPEWNADLDVVRDGYLERARRSEREVDRGAVWCGLARGGPLDVDLGTGAAGGDLRRACRSPRRPPAAPPARVSGRSVAARCMADEGRSSRRRC